MKIISFFNQKGGVGKTTSIINIGAAFGRQGKKVLIIDLDPQGNASSGLGIDKNNLEATIYEALSGEISLKEILLPTEEKGVDIIPSNAHLAAAERELDQLEDPSGVLKKLLEETTDYDFVLIDCPPSIGLLSINALVASHSLLIPIQAEYYALEGLGQLMDTMERIRESLNPELEIEGILITMYDRRNNLARDVDQELRNYFGDLVLNIRIPRNVRLAEAPSYGKSIFRHDRLSRGAFSYNKVSKELLK